MTVVIIWDGVVFIKREGAAWKRGGFSRLDEAADLLRENVVSGAQIRLIFDPESLITEIEEVPKGSRRVVGLALADRHAAITSESQVWGFQPQWPVPGKTAYATFLHTEVSPGLVLLRDRLERDLQVGIDGAWPLATPVFLPKPERYRAVLAVVHDAQQGSVFIGGHQQNGERLCMKLKQATPSRLWAELHDILRTAGANVGDGGGFGARITFFTTAAADQLEQACPFWRELSQLNDLHLENFDGFAQVIARLPVKHPSNLLKALPGDLRLDPILKGVAAFAAAALLTVAGIFGASLSRLNAREHALAAEHDRLAAQNRRLAGNQQEIANLKLLYGSDVGWTSPGRAEFLRALAASVPNTATATELVLDDSGSFRLTGYFWQVSDKDNLKTLVRPVERALAANLASLVVAEDRSVFEPKTGRFVISGILHRE